MKYLEKRFYRYIFVASALYIFQILRLWYGAYFIHFFLTGLIF